MIDWKNKRLGREQVFCRKEEKTNVQTYIHAAICICTLQTKANTYIYTYIIYSAGSLAKSWKNMQNVTQTVTLIFSAETHTPTE